MVAKLYIYPAFILLKRVLIISHMKTLFSMNGLHPGKYVLFALFTLLIGGFVFVSCGSSTEMVEVPTLGLITTVTEVSTDSWKIEDEQEVADTSDSRIIAKYMNGNIDTFTLAEARLMEKNGYSGSGGGIFRAASYGFMGYMIGRSMMGRRPSAGAYVDPNTYNRVNNSTGNRMRSTAKTVSRPSSGSKSGYGSSSGRSTRSYGG